MNNLTNIQPEFKKSRILIIVFAICIIIYCTISYLSNFLSALCTDNVITTEIESPDHQLKAVVFCRSATTTQVSIISSHQSLQQYEVGNVFIENLSQNYELSLNVYVKWIGPRELLIIHDSGAHIFRRCSQIDIYTILQHDRVKIKYQTYKTK